MPRVGLSHAGVHVDDEKLDLVRKRRRTCLALGAKPSVRVASALSEAGEMRRINVLCCHERGIRVLPACPPQNTLRPVKIGFLGGSFDPVHFGHLLAAQDAYEQHRLDRLVFVPAAQAPLKPNDVQSTTDDRLAMLRSSIEWDKRFEISDYELRRGGVSYTVDSARHFRSLYPNDELFWIVGGDQLPKLHLWKDVTDLVQLVDFIFLERPGYPVKEHPAIPGLKLHRCDGHLLAVSSTELRDRCRRGLSLDYFVPHNAIVYIQQRGLYRDPS